MLARLFLDPDDFAGIGMLGECGGDFRPRQRIELIEEENRGAGILAAAAFGAQFVADFAAGNQDAFGVVNFAVGDEGQKSRRAKSSSVRSWRRDGAACSSV